MEALVRGEVGISLACLLLEFAVQLLQTRPLRRVGADVPGDAVEAKLARAEAALEGNDVAKGTTQVSALGGFDLAITAPAGTIYYTLDGSAPTVSSRVSATSQSAPGRSEPTPTATIRAALIASIPARASSMPA